MRLVILAIAAIGLGFLWVQFVNIYPDNYVKIYVDTYLVEMSFTGFAILLLLLTAVLYLFFWLLGSLFRVGNVFSRWQKRRGHKKANEALGSGYLALIKGDWRKAEKSLVAVSDNSSVPYVNYLAAAQAAQEQSQFARRDEYLTAAYKAAPTETLAIGLAKARLHHLAGQHDQAEATLDDIEAQGRKNSQFVAMRLQNYQAMHNWGRVHDLLPVARKLDALPETVLEQLDTQAHRALLLNSDDRLTTWKSLPKLQQQHADNVLTYAQELVEKGDQSAAEKCVRNALKQQYDDTLVNFYGRLESDKPAKLRRSVEGWLMARPESAELNLAAGRLAAQEKNIELAITYLEKAIELGRLPEAYAKLGQLLETENESGRALQLYRSGLASLFSSADAIETKVINDSSQAQEGELVQS